MCRNIKILRAPYAVGVTDDDVHAAALQYVQTVGGVRLPGPHNEEAFNQAVETISAATRDLLARLEVSAEQAGGLAPALIARVPARGVSRGKGYGRPMVAACEISMESGGVRSTPSGSLR